MADSSFAPILIETTRDAPLERLKAVEPAPLGIEPADSSPIHSRFATHPRLSPIVSKFAARLREQLEQARQAHAEADFGELGQFGHWLAGAAGTMGYDGLTEPARELEAKAGAHDLAAIEGILTDLDGLCGRLVVPQVAVPT